MAIILPITLPKSYARQHLSHYPELCQRSVTIHHLKKYLLGISISNTMYCAHTELSSTKIVHGRIFVSCYVLTNLAASLTICYKGKHANKQTPLSERHSMTYIFQKHTT